MIFMGVLGKISAVLTTIPEPVVGGMFMVMFGVITATGISNLQVNRQEPFQQPELKDLFLPNEGFNDADVLPCQVHRHELLQDYIYFWLFHVFRPCHPKLDGEESRFPPNRFTQFVTFEFLDAP